MGQDKDLQDQDKDWIKVLYVKMKTSHDFMVKDNNTTKNLQIKLRTYRSRTRTRSCMLRTKTKTGTLWSMARTFRTTQFDRTLI